MNEIKENNIGVNVLWKENFDSTIAGYSDFS
jgi:hypothetical protein